MKMCADTVRRMHCRNVYLLVNDGRFPPFSGVFDKVLLDVPCSATGVLHRHPEARWTRKPEDINELAALQGSLLESASRLVGPGGTIVYSTCSVEPEENENQVALFLKNHPEFRHDGCPEGIPQMYINKDGFLAIAPFSHGIDGIFGARLTKGR
jgi:16S rRNA (cytosine967-C5)-methyltransferase